LCLSHLSSAGVLPGSGSGVWLLWSCEEVRGEGYGREASRRKGGGRREKGEEKEKK